MSTKFKDSDRIVHIYVQLSSSSQATNLLNGLNINPESVIAVGAEKLDVPCEVTWYCNFTKDGISTLIALTMTGCYNIGYRGEGPCTLFRHMEKLNFVTQENHELITQLVHGSNFGFYYEKGNPEVESY